MPSMLWCALLLDSLYTFDLCLSKIKKMVVGERGRVGGWGGFGEGLLD